MHEYLSSTSFHHEQIRNMLAGGKLQALQALIEGSSTEELIWINGYLNGLLQQAGIDYDETDPAAGVVTFSEGLLDTDRVTIECRTL